MASKITRLGVCFKLYAHNITTPDVVAFVAYLLCMVPRKVILIWDRWSVHRSALVELERRYPERLAIEWLPAYASELNPTEQVWNHTKYGDLANFTPEDMDQVADVVMLSITAQHHDNDLICSYFKYAQLEL